MAASAVFSAVVARNVFFAGQDIPADRFAEYGGVAVRVEQVVLQLESQSDVDPEVV